MLHIPVSQNFARATLHMAGKWAIAICLTCAMSAGAVTIPSLGEAGNYTVLLLSGGSVGATLNNSSSGFISGNIGLNGIIAQAQKEGSISGQVLISSTATGISSINTTNFVPSGGFLCGASGATHCPTGGTVDATVDTKLNTAQSNALAAASAYAALTANQTISGGLSSNLTVTNNTGTNRYVLDITGGISYNSDVLTLNGRANQDDFFIINVAGNMTWSQSQVVLNNVTSDHVIFNFTDSAASVLVNKSATVFNGTILAANGDSSIRYHNPATFSGALIAENITLDSASQLSGRTFHSAPEPGSAPLVILGMAMLGFFLRRKHSVYAGGDLECASWQ